jgi:arginase
MARRIGLIGAPTSAGAYAPGQEDAPAALRDAGLVERLRVAGAEVVDLGDTPRFRWRPDADERFAMNVGAVRAAALAVAERVGAALERGLLPLVIGGDCTVELGTVLGWQRQRDATPLVYVDPHPDLNTPAAVPDGALDWMGMAHLLGLPGARPELTDLGRLRPDDVLLFGYSAARATVAERDAIAEHGIHAIAQDEVADEGAARALEWTRGAPFLLHFDTDSIDFADLPLAENTDRNVGLPFDAVAAAVAALCEGELGAVTVTEINPHHGEPDGATLRRFLDRFVAALTQVPQKVT